MSKGRAGHGIGIARCRRPGNGAGDVAKTEKASQLELGPVFCTRQCVVSGLMEEGREAVRVPGDRKSG